VPVPRPLAARAVKNGFIYQADILVEKIEGANDLVDVLMMSSLADYHYKHIGKVIRQLHDTGVCHSDLNIHNILLDDKDAFWLIDFDKCERRSGEGWKKKNLNRLRRSFLKEVKKRQINWQLSDWVYLIAGYVSES
jgi:3-deoxy-D-manno-octulosonic acid kinase